MTTIIERLTNTERITDWLDPHDERLAQATGDPAPNYGGDIRDFWQAADLEEERVVADEVLRLIVPKDVCLRGVAQAFFSSRVWGTNLSQGTGNVELEFSDGSDWAQCFPTDRAEIFKTEDGRRSWAAVAHCGQVGLAVFAQERTDGSVWGRVQQVPDHIVESIQAVC